MSGSAVMDPPKGGLEAVPDPDLEEVGFPELVIEGDGQLSIKVGGRQPDQSTVVLTGGEVRMEGQFEKGQRVRFQIEGVVGEVHLIDLMDRKTGDVTGTKRKHVLKLDSLEKV